MFRRLLREYLSLTRGERRGMQVLSILVILLIIFRAIIPALIQAGDTDVSQAEKDFINFQDSLMLIESLSEQTHRELSVNVVKGSSVSSEPFLFDPNTASLDELITLGLSSRVAGTLINFRNAGGKFRKDSDLLRVYGLNPEVYKRLESYIDIIPSESDSVILTGNQIERNVSESSMYKRELFELNQADSIQLLSVYGIGPVFAGRIIRYREALGGFFHTDQLLEVYGLSQSQHSELIRSSYTDTCQLRSININRADEWELCRHPYLDLYQSRSIITYREQMGSISAPDELLRSRLLPDTLFARIRPYLGTGD